MKVLIAADMEGISGVVHWDQVSSNHSEYPRFREIMTQEVNAAIAGCFQAGANDVVVADGHAYGRNLLIEMLDSRARLISGTPSPLEMVKGIEKDINATLFVGYHAREGTQNAILAHTWSSKRVANLWLNNVLMGEIGLNAAVCGHFEVPVVFISSDQAGCAEAKELIQDITTVIVKKARGRMSAECTPPSVNQARIQEQVTSALQAFKQNNKPGPYKLDIPVQVKVEFKEVEMVDNAQNMPGVERLDGKTVAFIAEDMLVAYAAFQSLVDLA